MRGLLTHIKQTELQRGSFAELLLKAKDPKSGKPLTDAKMFPEIAALFFAGVDTAAAPSACETLLCALPARALRRQLYFQGQLSSRHIWVSRSALCISLYHMWSQL